MYIIFDCRRRGCDNRDENVCCDIVVKNFSITYDYCVKCRETDSDSESDSDTSSSNEDTSSDARPDSVDDEEHERNERRCRRRNRRLVIIKPKHKTPSIWEAEVSSEFRI